MHDDSPKPTKEWKWPSAEELNQFKTRLRQNSPEKLEIESICSGSLGLFLVLILILFISSKMLITAFFFVPSVCRFCKAAKLLNIWQFFTGGCKL